MAPIRGNLCTNLLELYRVVNKHVDKEDPVDITHVDFQKVFYHVPHRNCLKMLSCLEGELFMWI